jgi:hypothetical protein
MKAITFGPTATRAIFLLSLMGVLIVLCAYAFRSWRSSQQLDCQLQSADTARVICASIERHLEFTCCGHAVIDPGFRPTWSTIRDVWCEQRIDAADEEVLRWLTAAQDWRLASAAGSLLRLLTGRDESGAMEPPSSVFNSSNPAYLLREGCPPTR